MAVSLSGSLRVTFSVRCPLTLLFFLLMLPAVTSSNSTFDVVRYFLFPRFLPFLRTNSSNKLEDPVVHATTVDKKVTVPMNALLEVLEVDPLGE
jgi:hypothetical protein